MYHHQESFDINSSQIQTLQIVLAIRICNGRGASIRSHADDVGAVSLLARTVEPDNVNVVATIEIAHSEKQATVHCQLVMIKCQVSHCLIHIDDEWARRR